MASYAYSVVARNRLVDRACALAGLVLALALALPGGAAWAQKPPQVVCNGGNQLKVQDLMPGGQPDLLVNGPCNVDMAQNGANPTVFYYANVNITSSGSLNFNQPKTGNPDIDFWASGIVVEANGALTAGATGLGYGDPTARDDQRGGFLTIYLYGANQSVDGSGKPVDPITKPGQGVLCKSAGAGLGPCGVPTGVWANNGSTLLPGCVDSPGTTDCIPGLPKTTMDYFYQYGPAYGDGLCTNGSTFAVKNYKAMCGSDPADGQVGYFGYKVLAVSYGGSLNLRGYKGSETCAAVSEPGVLCPVLSRLDPGNSWMRLQNTMDLKPKQQILFVEGTPGDRWFLPTDADRTEKIGGIDVPVHPDQVIVTTTDYLPGHSEQLTLTGVQGSKITFGEPTKWFHSGTRYPIAGKLGTAQDRLVAGGMDKNLITDGAETRAAVALLTRNIRIVSAGDKAGETFAQAAARTLCPDNVTMGCYYFGGHTIFRQGFKQIQVQGVEFVQLGQGGKLGHYPIHFHKTRLVPPNTYVNDSSVNDSNTRWYVVHDTQGVTFQRDVGWKSIGHGYYFEDGTETDNNFYSDIGIFARAAIQNKQNPRMVPGILSNSNAGGSGAFAVRTRSDSEHPTVFWITNGWNNFEGDMAAGAGACGAAYWLVPMMNTDRPDVPTLNNDVGINPGDAHMKWDYDAAGHFGYAGFQTERNASLDTRYAGDTPLGVFYKNSATATMMSFQTTIDAPSCNGFVTAGSGPTGLPTVPEVKSFAPATTAEDLPSILTDTYYPHIFGKKGATACPLLDPSKPPGPNNYNCGTFSGGSFSNEVPDCSVATEQNCTMTVIDHFTSSFTWSDGAVAAVWLRPYWYLFDNSVITDVQNGGLNFITGGDMTHASLIPGYWAVAKSSIFVGHTQPQKGEPGYQTYNAFAADISPINSDSGLICDPLIAPGNQVPNYCIDSDEGVSFQLADFFVNQSLFRIYDGPNFEDGNAFLDINKADCTVAGYNKGCIYGTERIKGIPKSVINADQSNHDCYLPNAAIAWKQPNGFFYPPAFHSRNLYFGNVDIRHFVIDPLFKPSDGATIDFAQGGSYLTDETRVGQDYCNFNSGINATNPGSFGSFTGIDRQTELNDDDGTLTGLSNTVPAAIPPTPNLNQTISINEDEFFGAPIETPECASNISNPDGVNSLPANACKPTQAAAPPVTARTSPYDYVATVVYHPADSGIDGTGGNWSSDCTNPTCYGVPLYRQYLSGADGGAADGTGSSREWKQWYLSGCGTTAAPSANQPNCRWPFIRMSGMNRAVRETLTLNNATYYLDTAVPRSMQESEKFNTQGLGGDSITKSFNVFLGGQTYDVFFVYAKQSSKQIYQIYVGKGRDPAAVAASIQAVQVKIPGSIEPGPYTGSDQFLFVTAKDYDATSGIVSITVDFKTVTALAPTPANGLCQPQQFCGKGGTTGCTTTLTATDPLVIANPDLLAQATAVCGHWAIKDLDCPKDGCLGFSFSLPNDGSFSADASIMQPTPHRPRPTGFPTTNTNPDGSPQGDPNWLTKFLRTVSTPDSASGGQCYYPQLPGTDCAVP